MGYLVVNSHHFYLVHAKDLQLLFRQFEYVFEAVVVLSVTGSAEPAGLPPPYTLGIVRAASFFPVSKGEYLEIIYDEILKRVYEEYKRSPSDKIVSIYNKAVQSLYREKYQPLMEYLEALKEDLIPDENISSSVGFFQDYTKPTSLHYFTERFIENQRGIARGMAQRLSREKKPQRYADEEK